MEFRIDLREEIDEILKEYGYYVTYIRRLNEPCPVCGGIRGCQACYGTTRNIIKEDVLARRDTASVPETWPRSTSIKPVGTWHAPAYVYYFKYDTNPKSMDLIIDNGQLVEVNMVDVQRGHEGRIEYYRIATEHTPTKQQYV